MYFFDHLMPTHPANMGQATPCLRKVKDIPSCFSLCLISTSLQLPSARPQPGLRISSVFSLIRWLTLVSTILPAWSLWFTGSEAKRAAVMNDHPGRSDPGLFRGYSLKAADFQKLSSTPRYLKRALGLTPEKEVPQRDERILFCRILSPARRVVCVF